MLKVFPAPRIPGSAKTLLVIALTAILLGAAPALAQTTPSIVNMEITEIYTDCVWVEWEILDGPLASQLRFSNTDADQVFTGTGDHLNAGIQAFQVTGLTAETTYYFGVRGVLTGGATVDSAVVSATTLAAGTPCDTTGGPPNSRLYPEIAFTGSECVWLAWNQPPRVADTDVYNLSWLEDGSSDPPQVRDDVPESPYLITGLTAGATYMAGVSSTSATEKAITFTTASETTDCPETEAALNALLNPPKKKKKKAAVEEPVVVPTARPMANTCPELLPGIVISGYVVNSSQCQLIDAGGVGRMDLIERGIVAAVDIWSWVPSGVEICFRAMGAEMVFLDAAYSPRMLMPLETTVRDGHSCAMIDSAGTVVLLAS